MDIIARIPERITRHFGNCWDSSPADSMISSKAVRGQRQKSDVPAKLQVVIALDLVVLRIGTPALFLWHAHRLRDPIVDSCQFFLR